MTPRQEERLRNKIKKAKATLQKAKRIYGYFDDSYGLRYEIGLTYFQLGDHEELMKYYKWFYKNFEDDIGSPELHLAWINASKISGKLSICYSHLVRLEEINLYLIPLLTGEKLDELPIWHGMNWSQKDYAEYVVQKYGEWVNPEVLEFLRETTQASDYHSFKQLVIQQKIKLNVEKDFTKRREVMEEEERIMEEWRKSLNS